MNASKFSNALGSINESYINEAITYTAGKKSKIWKGLVTIAACLALVVSLSVGGAMMIGREDVEVPEKPEANGGLNDEQSEIVEQPYPDIFFSNLDELRKYMSDKDNQTIKIDNMYIDFNSIIPDSEIAEISVRRTNWYQIEYIKKNDSIPYNIAIDVMNHEKYDMDLDGMKENDVTNEIPCKSIDELKDFTSSSTLNFVHAKLGKYDLVYYRGVNVDNFESLIILINGYRIEVRWFENYTIDDYTPAQSEFLSALVPAYGATDDSVIEMLDKIKALIPQ